MDDRQRIARMALLAHEVKIASVSVRSGEPLSVETAVLLVRRAPGDKSANRVVMTGAEWDEIGDRARMIAAAKGQAVRVIDGREFRWKGNAHEAAQAQARQARRADVRGGRFAPDRHARGAQAA